MDNDDDLFPDHKLCGFLYAVLSVSSPQPDLRESLIFGTRCYLSGEGSEVGFTTENGFLLSPIVPTPKQLPNSKVSFRDCEQCETPWSGAGFDSMETAEVSANSRVLERENGVSRSKRLRRMGLVHGSISIVHQIYALVMHKCLKINAIVVRVEDGGDGETRVVVLVDVYLPLALWSGWKFPRAQSIAGALFRHLSCDWEERSSMLASRECSKDTHGVSKSIWNLPDCHVIGCKMHYDGRDLSKRRLYELHEIFSSLSGIAKKGKPFSSRIHPENDSCQSGIWDVSDDILVNLLDILGPKDLIRVSSTCRHLKSLAVSIMPCMKLKLFPHQQAAVEWMLHRERNAQVLLHPLYLPFSTKDGFAFHVNTVSGDIITGVTPTITDFCGGMFCDEPGLGKTVTALSLILKTHGTLADPPAGVRITWCPHNGDQRCGYYEVSAGERCGGNNLLAKRDLGVNGQRGMGDSDYATPKRARLLILDEQLSANGSMESPIHSEQAICVVRCTRSLSRIQKNLSFTYEAAPGISRERKVGKKLTKMKHASIGPGNVTWPKRVGLSNGILNSQKMSGKVTAEHIDYNDTWVQCDACHKWRKLAETSIADSGAAWFCSMNPDPLYQSCIVSEESWDMFDPITNLPGFYTKGTAGAEEKNISFFISVLKEHYPLINSATRKTLAWLANLTPEKLSQMETIGLRSQVLSSYIAPGVDGCNFHHIFQAFGLTRRVEKGVGRWYYPSNLQNLEFDVAALKIALSKPLDLLRLYLSRATLIVVPSNLVDHWKTQIQKHVRPGQLRLYVWVDHKKLSAHSLAWDYDIVITTFNRLSAEWGPRKRSILMQVHWLRVILDEGHTLGSSLNLTNKLQMAISLTASNRWILTGTPTPNTPNSQLSHLLPLLKFLHEEPYGQDKKSWEAGILRPFEAEMEEGRSNLLHLLQRCMISARKIDLQTIPPCIKKVVFLNFTEEHARSYNELVVTVRRNILMADWNDPSHVESLLNPKQWKFRSATIKNVRLSCCVAGHIKVTDAGEDIQETMDILVDKGLDPKSQEYAFIKHNILYGGNCVRCKEWCRLPVITPCRHLLCLDCVALDSERCTYPGCANLYEMQTPETLARPENPNPKWPVPKDLIELQPSYKQDNWDPDWQSTSSSKVTNLVERLKVLKEASAEAKCCNIGCKVAKHTVQLISPHTINSSNLQIMEVDCARTSTGANEVSPEKVLIFSQFLEHINVIEQQLTIAGIKFAGMYSPMHSSNKMKSLAMFQHDTSCMVLLMDGSAALGLDLSFVTHVFLMEPIWDRSMEEQVISRAHRMGATRPIHVETLVMRGTIEEQMVQFLQDTEECRMFLKQEFGKHENEGARGHRSLHDIAGSNYLSQLSFVRTNPKM